MHNAHGYTRLRLLRTHHAEELASHKECVSEYPNEPGKCRETQEILDRAMKQRLNRRYGK